MHLTNSPSEAHKATAESVAAESAGAPVHEIEVTDAMLDAAADVARLYDREDPPDWLNAAVYRAMETERRKLLGEQC
jgi:hypothetical protein